MSKTKKKIFKNIIFKKLANYEWINSHELTDTEFDYIYNVLHLNYLRTEDIKKLVKLVLYINREMQAGGYNSNLWRMTIKVLKAINIVLQRRNNI